jgi:hypothetical protein
MSTMTKPTVGRIVHYQSFGTPVRADGSQAYTPQCRAAIVAEVGQWVTVETEQPDSYSTSEGRPIRTLTQWWYDDALALTVCNPTGLFFNGAGLVACKHDEPRDGHTPEGGTWHWPERVDEPDKTPGYEFPPGYVSPFKRHGHDGEHGELRFHQ